MHNIVYGILTGNYSPFTKETLAGLAHQSEHKRHTGTTKQWEIIEQNSQVQQRVRGLIEFNEDDKQVDFWIDR